MAAPALSRREFLIHVSSVSAVVAAGGVLSSCGGGDGGDGGGGGDGIAIDDSPMVRFDFGVASGDPLHDRVILWTHARFADNDADVPLRFEVARDAAFTDIVSSGDATAAAAAGHTAKVDAAGLEAGGEYFFRFRRGRWLSAVGRTRTLPAAGVAEVKFAVFSCANYPAGFFHVYGEAATRSDAQYAIHLGDYLYEFGVDGFASENAEQLGRVSEPPTELLTLADYRRRYAQYRTDPDLLNLHARLPMIAVWDDHELADNAWEDGADNHTEGVEGSFVERRAAAQQAWHEWMPVRTGPDRSRIWRSFQFGNLLSLHMLDTRMAGRDRQVGFDELLDPATAVQARATLTSPTRQMLGAEQAAWLQQQLAASTATWQVLGQQVLMSRIELPVSLLQALFLLVEAPGRLPEVEQAIRDYLVARATPPSLRTEAQAALLDTDRNPKIGYNPDAWDGYPAAREAVLATVEQLNKRLVVLAGDTHNAWYADLTLADGSKAGEEFATSSVSSPGLEADLQPLLPSLAKELFENVVDDLKWMEPSHRGYLELKFTASQARADWFFVDTVVSRSYQVLEPHTESFAG